MNNKYLDINKEIAGNKRATRLNARECENLGKKHVTKIK
jgi:hypothetical protein